MTATKKTTRKKAEKPDIVQAEIAIPYRNTNDDQSGYEIQQALGGSIQLNSRGGLHVNAQLGKSEAITFIKIRNALRMQKASLSDGKPVWSNVEALRWMMEQVAASV